MNLMKKLAIFGFLGLIFCFVVSTNASSEPDSDWRTWDGDQYDARDTSRIEQVRRQNQLLNLVHQSEIIEAPEQAKKLLSAYKCELVFGHRGIAVGSDDQPEVTYTNDKIIPLTEKDVSNNGTIAKEYNKEKVFLTFSVRENDRVAIYLHSKLRGNTAVVADDLNGIELVLTELKDLGFLKLNCDL
jgi:hypothetical protein